MKLLEKLKNLLRKTLPPDNRNWPDLITAWYCYHHHHKVSRPIEGRYICFECGRNWRTPF